MVTLPVRRGYPPRQVACFGNKLINPRAGLKENPDRQRFFRLQFLVFGLSSLPSSCADDKNYNSIPLC
ncbi:hypothetical protein MPL1032_110211 [Mesorhizobium plurifarium]|uniref:Uncharacterized protein n=1 Tax=Mesorhizobium plurifarium TaxID=69974 RepID=A0A0K2VQD8_MESPL|nr:hypothetical protein MPL1032_110211 [Mesorhizobium plurifarium]